MEGVGIKNEEREEKQANYENFGSHNYACLFVIEF